jgi:hypothetical protein
MADEDTGSEQQQPPHKGGAPKSLMAQAKEAVTKSARESVLNKLKEIMKKRSEHEKGIALCDAEAKKLVEDFENGIL